MKKVIKLILGVGVLAVLIWFVIDLNASKGQSDTELIEFAIKEVETISKVIITDPQGYKFELRKNDATWTDKDGGCINQESAGFVLDALRNIEFKGYLPDGSHENSKAQMATQHIKVEIFQNGEWSKTWYIGPASQDHYGQIMQLDSKKDGKSAYPVIMKIKGVYGIIAPRFFGDPRQWLCSEIFSLELDEISKIEVKNIQEPQRSFSVTKNGADMKVYQQNTLLQNVDTSMIFRYLNSYKKVHFEKPNYELNIVQLDSLKNTTPFAELYVTDITDVKKMVKCFRIIAKEDTEINTEMESIVSYRNSDQDRFWAELPNGQIVKCQYYVFNPLLLGHIFFPMDVTMLKTHDGIKPKEE